MDTILVLVDFTIKAECAAKFAVQFAIKNKASLILCHAIEPAWQFANNSRKIKDQKKLKKEKLIELEKAAVHLKEIIIADDGVYKPQINFLVIFGSLTDIVKHIIIEQKIDLVVAGTHPSNFLERLLLGSHIHSLINELTCPLLIVPEDLSYKGIQNIGYATDLSFDDTRAIDYLTEIAKPFESALSINYVILAEYMENKVSKSSGFPVPFKTKSNYPFVTYHRIEGENAKLELLAITRSKSLNILAFVHRRYRFFETFINKGICNLLAYYTKPPLLILPDSFSATLPVNEPELSRTFIPAISTFNL